VKTAFVAASVCCLGLMFPGQSAQAESFEHIDGLAVELKAQAEAFRGEVRQHYRHTPQYRHLYQDATEMARLADHLHEVAHHGGNIRHLRSDVASLDRTFHHVEELVDQMSHSDHGYDHGSLSFGRGHRRSVGFRSGSSSGVSHLKRQLRAMENTLHHMQDDLR